MTFSFKIQVSWQMCLLKKANITAELETHILVIIKWQILLLLVYVKYILMHTDFPRKLPQLTRENV